MTKLFAPAEFWNQASDCSGCGTDGWKGQLVPNNFFLGGWFKSELLRTCCCIHDYMYAEGEGVWDKETADRTFLNNMLRCVKGDPKLQKWNWKWLRYIRVKQCEAYYFAVRYGGGPAFWEGKNKSGEMR